MLITKILEIKKACIKARRTIEGVDCNKCPLAGVMKLSLGVQSFGTLEDGEIELPINPCLLLDDIARLIK